MTVMTTVMTAFRGALWDQNAPGEEPLGGENAGNPVGVGSLLTGALTLRLKGVNIIA